MKHLCTLFLALMILPLMLSGQPAETLQSTYLFAAMAPGNEIPPVEVGGEFAMATGAVAIHALRDHNSGEIVKAFVNFNVQYFLDVPQDLRAMHIHRGRPNQNGPVVVGSDMTPIDGARIGAITPPQLELTSPMQLATIKAILENPQSFYLNLHSRSNPLGLMRGQLGSTEVTQLRNLTKLSETTAGHAANTAATVEFIADLARRIALKHGVLKRGE